MKDESPENIKIVSMFDRKWIKTLGMALSLPSTIIFAALLSKKLVDENVLGWGYSSLIFIAIVSNTIFLMVYYAYKNKK